MPVLSTLSLLLLVFALSGCAAPTPAYFWVTATYLDAETVAIVVCNPEGGDVERVYPYDTLDCRTAQITVAGDTLYTEVVPNSPKPIVRGGKARVGGGAVPLFLPPDSCYVVLQVQHMPSTLRTIAVHWLAGHLPLTLEIGRMTKVDIIRHHSLMTPR